MPKIVLKFPNCCCSPAFFRTFGFFQFIPAASTFTWPYHPQSAVKVQYNPRLPFPASTQSRLQQPGHESTRKWPWSVGRLPRGLPAWPGSHWHWHWPPSSWPLKEAAESAEKEDSSIKRSGVGEAIWDDADANAITNHKSLPSPLVAAAIILIHPLAPTRKVNVNFCAKPASTICEKRQPLGSLDFS